VLPACKKQHQPSQQQTQRTCLSFNALLTAPWPLRKLVVPTTAGDMTHHPHISNAVPASNRWLTPPAQGRKCCC
jgi:hypothetical protein